MSAGVCSICGKGFSYSGSRKTKGRVFCGLACRSQAAKNSMSGNNADSGYAATLTSGTVGAIHELVVAADCLKAGLSVFRSVDPVCKVDFLILKDMKPFRLEVTSGSLYGEKLQFPRKDLTRFDLLAVVFRDWNIRYAAVVDGSLVWADSVASALAQFAEQAVAA